MEEVQASKKLEKVSGSGMIREDQKRVELSKKKSPNGREKDRRTGCTKKVTHVEPILPQPSAVWHALRPPPTLGSECRMTIRAGLFLGAPKSVTSQQSLQQTAFVHWFGTPSQNPSNPTSDPPPDILCIRLFSASPTPSSRFRRSRRHSDSVRSANRSSTAIPRGFSGTVPRRKHRSRITKLLVSLYSFLSPS